MVVSLRSPSTLPNSPSLPARLSVPTSSQFWVPTGAAAGRFVVRLMWTRAIELSNHFCTTKPPMLTPRTTTATSPASTLTTRCDQGRRRFLVLGRQ